MINFDTTKKIKHQLISLDISILKCMKKTSKRIQTKNFSLLHSKVKAK